MAQNCNDFFILNDYCLEAILAYLDIKAQLQFAKVSKQFHRIFISRAKRKHTTIQRSIFQQLSANEWKEYIKLVGLYVTKSGYGLPAGTMLDIRKYCPQIREIYYPLWGQKNDRDVALGLKSLQIIHFHENCSNEEMAEAVLRLKKLPNLRCISMKSVCYDGKHLCKLTRLKELHLFGCCSFLPQNLADCFRAMKNLRFLNLNCIHISITTEVFSALTNNCKYLEELHLAQIDVDFGKLANLRKLKSLVISCNRNSFSMLNALAVSSLSIQLEELTLEYSKITYQEAKLIALFKSLKKLDIGIGEERCLEQLKTLKGLAHLKVFSYKKYHHKYILNLLAMCQQLKTFKTHKLKDYRQFIMETIDVLRLIRNPKIQEPLVICIPDEIPNEQKKVLQSTEFKNARHLIKIKLKNAHNLTNIVVPADCISIY